MKTAITYIEGKKEPKTFLSMEEQAKINEAKKQLKPNVRITETPKFLKASPELQWRMLCASKQRRLRNIRNSWIGEGEDNVY